MSTALNIWYPLLAEWPAPLAAWQSAHRAQVQASDARRLAAMQREAVRDNRRGTPCAAWWPTVDAVWSVQRRVAWDRGPYRICRWVSVEDGLSLDDAIATARALTARVARAEVRVVGLDGVIRSALDGAPFASTQRTITADDLDELEAGWAGRRWAVWLGEHLTKQTSGHGPGTSPLGAPVATAAPASGRPAPELVPGPPGPAPWRNVSRWEVVPNAPGGTGHPLRQTFAGQDMRAELERARGAAAVAARITPGTAWRIYAVTAAGSWDGQRIHERWLVPAADIEQPAMPAQEAA